MIKYFSRIYNDSGIGPTHVTTRTGHMTIRRWGIWCPYFSILFCKILPVQQVLHDHEGTFISFILWGQYTELTYDPNTKKKETRHHKWVNLLTHNKFHEIQAEQPAYTLLFMGPTKNSTSVIIDDRIIPATKLIKGYR